MNIITPNWKTCKSRELIDIKCDYCSKIFNKTKHRIMDSLRKNKRDVLFCSSDCSSAFHDSRIFISCITCSKEVLKNNKFSNKNCFCSHSCAAKYTNFHSKPRKRGPAPNPKSKRYIIKNKIKNPRTLKYSKIHSLICAECHKSFLGESFRKYCSRKCSNKNSFHPNSTIVHSSVYKGYKLDSGAELYFAQQLDLNNIQWIKNDGFKFKKFFNYIDSVGKSRKYYPDFFLPDYNIWVEIKGRKYIRQDDPLKLAAVNIPIILLISNDFKTNLAPFLNYLAV